MTPAGDLTRLPELQVRDPAALRALFADVYLGTVAYVGPHGPDALPTAVALHDGRLVWHGSTGSGWMRRLADGSPVAVSVTALDGVVVARASFESSFWYRSAVVRGVPRVLEGDERLAALDAIVERILPGRTAETRVPSTKELAATVVLALELDDWTLKVSRDWPEDLPADVAGDAWAGVVPVEVRHSAPLDAPDLRAGIPVAPSCLRLVDGAAGAP
jgi:nitroimidazol reductase NimA-like FMN-containing flavoprotein (pyridoxamine 5'-phosphate oxidase superfamily)